MSFETDMATIKQRLEDIKEDIVEMKICLFGNGNKGLKARIITLEAKFWIILLVTVPLLIYVIEQIIG